MFVLVNVFIECRNCGHQNRIDDIPVRRADLAVFRGSEDPAKCRNCQSAMDTMTAYCGEQVGSEINRREDPKL
jgi:Zn ribbon nucleic-acid-binding protein